MSKGEFSNMKKINFKNLPNNEILGRDELEEIVGGNGSNDDGSSTSNCTATCECPSGYILKERYGEGIEFAVSITCDDGYEAIDGDGIYCITPSDYKFLVKIIRLKYVTKSQYKSKKITCSS